MLHKVLCDHQAAGGKLRQASGHSGIDDHIHTVLQTQDLCRHGSIHLADTAGAGNDPRCSLVERHTGHGLKCLQLLGPRQGMKLRRHGKLQSNFHYITLLLPSHQAFSKYRPLFPKGIFDKTASSKIRSQNF